MPAATGATEEPLLPAPNHRSFFSRKREELKRYFLRKYEESKDYFKASWQAFRESFLAKCRRFKVYLSAKKDAVKKYFSGWQGATNALDALGHLANIFGVGIHLACSFLPLAVATALGPIAAIADPLIYCFRATERAVRLLGRKRGFKFDEEKNGTHPLQSKADIFAAILFIAAITLFFCTPAAPICASLAWSFGLGGVSIGVYFDHRHPENTARKKWNENPQDEAAFKDYREKYYSTRLYYGLIFSLVLLLILGSATGIGLPVALNSLLVLTTQLGSVMLVAINIARFMNAHYPETLAKILPGPKRVVVKEIELKNMVGEEVVDKNSNDLTGNARMHQSVSSTPRPSPGLGSKEGEESPASPSQKSGSTTSSWRRGPTLLSPRNNTPAIEAKQVDADANPLAAIAAEARAEAAAAYTR